MPFITIATNPSLTETNPYFSAVFRAFGFESASNFVIAFGIALIAFYVFRGALLLLQTYLIQRFSYGRFHIIAYNLFRSYLRMPYSEFTRKNSSKFTRTIFNEVTNLITIIVAFLNFATEISVVLILYAILLFVNWKITAVLTVFLLFQTLLMLLTLSKTIKKHGEARIRRHSALYSMLNDSLGNFKLIKLLGNYEELFSRFSKASYGYAKSNIVNYTLQAVPRLFLETLGFSILIALVVYVIYRYQDATFVIPIVSMFALALYRLLPSVQRIMQAINTVQFYIGSLRIVHADLQGETESGGGDTVEFNREIALHNVSFSYEKEKSIISGVAFKIKRGEKVGFVGESGSGKSTIVDLIAGIYKPESGEIAIDGVPLCGANIKSWRRKIGYIPQEIYLFDGTVGDNVSFGYTYDADRATAALKKAHIWQFLSKHGGLDAKVGEGGVLLSGGQKQRVGIARALYGDPEILILDEATSALDSETEAKIMDEIYGAAASMTLLIIAHRAGTLARCDRIYRVENGAVMPA
ncbi:MAG: ABC transporter ATP-binding protein [Helicobacteraceae bacterium]|nr:ABC transporter ATP-binding protein [Helicobacteraceae bacterium]